MVLSAGVYALRNIPLDAIPDLSDTQVIIYTEWPGQAPQLVQDQVTYPITTKMLSVPKAKVVRGYSFYGFSFVYVIFEDGTDPYWARSRVLEYLSGLAGSLPRGRDPAPRAGRHRRRLGVHVLAQLAQARPRRAALDAGLVPQYQLASVEGVAEVASVGGFVKQYQITVDPDRLRAYDLSLQRRRDGGPAQQRRGRRPLDRDGARRNSCCGSAATSPGLDDLRKIAVGLGPGGTPILLGEVANVQLGSGHAPRHRRAERRGRDGRRHRRRALRRRHPRRSSTAVKARLDEAMKSLPPDVTLHGRLRPHAR